MSASYYVKLQDRKVEHGQRAPCSARRVEGDARGRRRGEANSRRSTTAAACGSLNCARKGEQASRRSGRLSDFSFQLVLSGFSQPVNGYVRTNG
eukprot:6173701-Pleurochrysis_carterae.AAC.2